MAGLQQYNFFPTDLFYPRPQPTASPTVLPLKTPNTEDLPQTQQPQKPAKNMIKSTPSTSSLVYAHKIQSFGVVDNKLSKLSPYPFSLMVWMDQENQELSSKTSF
ncbi:hypothetical protein L195_g039640 [Trifolium pratense]|uniref:Uncharacterized protein n=2 Tax=Trifolium pratense TaxID=57577 RepID=A0ACB0LSR2_TRIPR|nr:hypothetical protein L195_g039640 [Trifolium pratense]CAJ2671585.1 unnamed protein product [Trifolium pratense]